MRAMAFPEARITHSTARRSSHRSRILPVVALLCLGTVLVGAPDVRAHCDTLDGPVVTDARRALERGDLFPVLKWIAPQYESETRDAFEHTLDVRRLSPEARELADRHSFETLVRLHRAGEGEPFTSLKPAGTTDPVLEAADGALQDGSADRLIDAVIRPIASELRVRFDEAAQLRPHAEERPHSPRSRSTSAKLKRGLC
ncbi:MAG: hypothetical protein KBD56_04615 [Candidatus Eisenbacteria bacterium]|nr:hypothetical protein [Candidatus Eisenbacteria bacterium]